MSKKIPATVCVYEGFTTMSCGSFRSDDFFFFFFIVAAGRSRFWHRRVGLGQAARVLLVARPHRILVDDGTEQGCRGNQMGHVVWRRKILSGERFKSQR